MLVDQRGNVWVVQNHDFRDGRVMVCQPGGDSILVTLPGADAHTCLVSDVPGSVWAWTRQGLHHLVANDAKAPAHYAVTDTFAVTGLTGVVEQLDYSALGCLVIRTCVNEPKPVNMLYLIPLDSVAPTNTQTRPAEERVAPEWPSVDLPTDKVPPMPRRPLPEG